MEGLQSKTYTLKSRYIPASCHNRQKQQLD